MAMAEESGAASSAMLSCRPQLHEGEHCVVDVGLSIAGVLTPIAVNRRYICYYLLSSNSVRILGRNVASCGLFQGHSQRITDIKFFSESIDRVASVSAEGRLFVWKIVEDVGTDDKLQLLQCIVFALHIEGPWNSVQPRICWHPQSQECLLVCIGDRVLKVDLDRTPKNSSHFKDPAEHLLSCHVNNLIDGIFCICHHKAEVTAIATFLSDRLYIASASIDGTVGIWAAGQASPLAVLMPHEGQPAGGVFFVTSPAQPDNAIMLTSDTNNTKLKLWVPANSHSCCVWHYVQTLELTNSISLERVSMNPIYIAPQSGFILVPRLDNRAFYCVLLKSGDASCAVRLHYLAEFLVSIPFLGFTAVIETQGSCKDIAHVFNVQNEAVEEYFLDIPYSHSSVSNAHSLVSSSAGLLEEEFTGLSVDSASAKDRCKTPIYEAKQATELTVGSPGLTREHCNGASSGSGFGSWVEVPSWIAASVKRSLKAGSVEAKDFEEKKLAYCVNLLASGLGAGITESQVEGSHFKSISGDASNKQYLVSKSFHLSGDLVDTKTMEDGVASVRPVPLKFGSHDVDFNGLKQSQEDAKIKLQGTSTATSSELLRDICGVDSSKPAHGIDTLDVTVVGATGFEALTQSGSKSFEPGNSVANSTVCSEEGVQVHSAMLAVRESVEFYRKCQEQGKREGLGAFGLLRLANGPKKKRNRRKSKGNNSLNRFTAATPVLNLVAEQMSSDFRTPEYGMAEPSGILREDKSQALEYAIAETSGISREQKSIISHSVSPSPNVSLENLSLQITTMQESLDKLLKSQTNFHESFYSIAESLMFTEAVPSDTSLQECRNNNSGACLDSSWMQNEERWAKVMGVPQYTWAHELQNVIKESFDEINTPASIPLLMAEVLQTIGSKMGLLISSDVNNALATFMSQSIEDFSKSFMKYSEKFLEGILINLVREQVKSIWLTFWKHLMQEELTSHFSQEAVLNVEQSFAKLIERGHHLQDDCIGHLIGLIDQHLNSTDLAVTSSLKDTLLSVHCIASSLREGLQDAEKSAWTVPEHSNARYNINDELLKLLQQGYLEDAFTLALSTRSGSVTAWICKQVDVRAVLSGMTPPLSQEVVLSLLVQLASDLRHESGEKLAWMEHACLALNPEHHPELHMRMRRALGEVFSLLQRQINAFSDDVKVANQARLVMHLVNSLFALCA